MYEPSPAPAPPTPLSILRSVYGYEGFRPGQAPIIERIMAGGDAALIMPTGGGKSLCFQIPALLRPGVALVVSPLIALMQDQVDALRQLGVAAAFLNSSLSARDKQDVLRRLEEGTLDLLYAAPERVMMPAFLELLDTTPLSLIAIDEAHCISQWGHDFRPEYLQLSDLRRRYPDVPCLAVTATADAPTQEEILKRLDFGADDLFVTGFDRPNIRYAVVVKNNPKQQLLRFIEQEHPDEAGIVYCLSRKEVEDTAAWLQKQGLEALPYHAGLTAREREANQTRFLREEGLIIVATVAFGMGIDKPNVRFVAHLNIPKSLEAYYQETGRAGRDGLPADAWMTYSLRDVVLMRKMLEGDGLNGAHKWAEQHKLNALIGYCETAECRRKVLLTYFGDDPEGPCGHCDTCLNPVETWDGTVAAQKVFSCIVRTGQRFGAAHIVDVLLGKDTAKVQRFGHDRLPTFGVGDDRSATAWRSVIRQLVAANYIRVDISGYGGLSLTAAAKPVLQGAETLELRTDPTPARKRTAKTKVKTTSVLTDPADQALFATLREVRLGLAREQEVPPYVIFHDRTLAAMAEHRPQTLDAMSTLSGVGAVKLERYGSVFLEALLNAE
ncbi:MAG: DNA helicase RecQ [Bacteroidota bacterium]